MKKEIAAFIVLIIFMHLALITALQISCSDNKPISDQNEIKTGNTKVINDLGIGVISSTESPFYNKFSAELLIDGKKSIVSNETNSESIQLLTGTYTINLVKANSTTATISIDGDSKEILLKETELVKGIYVMITDIEIVETGPIVRLIVGSQKITLSNDQNPFQKVSLNNKSFILEIISASTNNALIKVSKCQENEIILITDNEESNQTFSQSKVKQKTEEEKILEENLKANASTKQVSVAEINARKRNQSIKTNESDNLESEKEIKKTFFSKIWNWIKGIFGFEDEAEEVDNTYNDNNNSENATNLTNNI